MFDNLKDAIKSAPVDAYDGITTYADSMWNDNDNNVTFEGRRNAIQLLGGAAVGAAAVDAVDDDDNMVTRTTGVLGWAYQNGVVDPLADELEERDQDQGGSVDQDQGGSVDVGGGDASNGSVDDFSYNSEDLPYDSIADGLAYQSDSAIDAFDDEVVEAFFNRDEDSQEVVDDAYIDVEDSTTREYLEASSDEREDIDVFLGFENGSEGTKLRGSASAGMNEDFEEYMVGLNHLGRFDNEMQEYMQEVEDMLD